MTITPGLNFVEDVESEEIETSATYAIDFDTGRISTRLIDGIDAIKQFVILSLRTERFAYAIYSHDIGSELKAVCADEEASDAYKEMEIPRVIEEALLYDERIEAISNMEVEKSGDSFFVSFTVESEEGLFDVQEVVGDAGNLSE
ncbi:DUF2634 domain-containing protein [Alkalicoccobacillus gibsonii]|uniref:DUF2634 domain-containing protein n=1 Tax=Alkalicoccobacillus gibsonii TaxID=79881 RepID=UPI0019341654|nr:DUF2634 domain-containing protein [Alkalicoccobacillus gibsonii]MBM0064923.1 DUF2634 domain-containing protein [Alkalicoccobacillus gibsonii]